MTVNRDDYGLVQDGPGQDEDFPPEMRWELPEGRPLVHADLVPYFEVGEEVYFASMPGDPVRRGVYAGPGLHPREALVAFPDRLYDGEDRSRYHAQIRWAQSEDEYYRRFRTSRYSRVGRDNLYRGPQTLGNSQAVHYAAAPDSLIQMVKENER